MVVSSSRCGPPEHHPRAHDGEGGRALGERVPATRAAALRARRRAQRKPCPRNRSIPGSTASRSHASPAPVAAGRAGQAHARPQHGGEPDDGQGADPAELVAGAHQPHPGARGHAPGRAPGRTEGRAEQAGRPGSTRGGAAPSPLHGQARQPVRPAVPCRACSRASRGSPRPERVGRRAGPRSTRAVLWACPPSLTVKSSQISWSASLTTRGAVECCSRPSGRRSAAGHAGADVQVGAEVCPATAGSTPCDHRRRPDVESSPRVTQRELSREPGQRRGRRRLRSRCRRLWKVRVRPNTGCLAP